MSCQVTLKRNQRKERKKEGKKEKKQIGQEIKKTKRTKVAHKEEIIVEEEINKRRMEVKEERKHGRK